MVPGLLFAFDSRISIFLRYIIRVMGFFCLQFNVFLLRLQREYKFISEAGRMWTLDFQDPGDRDRRTTKSKPF